MLTAHRWTSVPIIVALLAVTASAQVVGPVPGPLSIELGPGCGSPTPALSLTAPVLGRDVVISVASDFPNAHGFLFVSAATTNFFQPVPGCVVYLDLTTAVVLSEFFTDAQGAYYATTPVPDIPALAGLEFNFQASVWASGGPILGDFLSNGQGVRTGDCGDCNGKVTALTLRYEGSAANANIVVRQKDNTIVFSGVVQPGGLFSFVGLESNGTFDTEVKIRVNGGPETKIHTSCSQPIGPGLQVGEFEVIEGASRLGGPLCPIGVCEDKPCQLILLYTGADCSATQHTQDPSKVSCAGTPSMAPMVVIRASDKSNPNDSGAKVWFQGPVQLGQAFRAEAANAGETKLTNETFVHLFDTSGNLLQQVKFHTSCSQPLTLGDRFGGVQLVNFAKEGTCPGSDLCTQGGPRVLTMEYTGDDCSATTHAQDPSKVSCAGNPQLAPMVTIRASNKADPTDPSALVWFSGPVGINQTFQIDAANGNENKLKTETFVHVFGPTGTLLQSVRFHTSCSQPLRLIDQFGSLALRGFTPDL